MLTTCTVTFLHFLFFFLCLTFKSWCWFLRASIRVRVPNGFIGFFCFWCWWFLRFRSCIRWLLSCYRKQTPGFQMLHVHEWVTVAHLSLCFDASAASWHNITDCHCVVRSALLSPGHTDLSLLEMLCQMQSCWSKWTLGCCHCRCQTLLRLQQKHEHSAAVVSAGHWEIRPFVYHPNLLQTSFSQTSQQELY